MTTTPATAFTPHPAPRWHGAPLRPGLWREQVRSRSTRLRSEARWLLQGDETAQQVEVFDALDQADRLSETRVRDPLMWLSGSHVEECWRLLRQAEEGILYLVSDDRVLGRAQSALAHADETIGAQHRLSRALGAAMARKVPQEVRAAALDVVRASHEHSDERHRAVRSFRNQLLGLTAVLAVMAGALVLVQWLLPSSVRLVPYADTGGVSPTTALVLVLLFGCIGALFSAVPSLAQIPEQSQPFNLARQQSALKVVVGGWSAVIGLMVLHAGLAGPQPAEVTAALPTTTGLLVLAALFGAGQEAVTRFADHKASSLLGG